ncbi:MAG: YtxH domain-containing protein [Vicinamibacterales bacterium]
MARDDSGAGLVMMAFALGAIAGAAAALLMAPATGEETRRTLGDRAREGKNTLNTALERGRQAYQQARGGVEAGPGEAL